MVKTTGYTETVEQDVHSTSVEPRSKLGTITRTADGRIYRYAKAGATALDAGKMTTFADSVANHTNVAVAGAVDVGEFTVTVTLGATAATANQYEGGYLVVNDADGEGTAYQIASHPAADGSATLEVTLAEPVAVALTTDSEASLRASMFSDVVVAGAGAVAVGAPNVPVEAGEYFWAQTGGVASILAGGTVAAGANITTGASGAVVVNAGNTTPVIGSALGALVSTEYRPVFLSIDS